MIYERMKAGTFPTPVQIGTRAVAWDEEEVAEWQQNLARGVKKMAL
jgi:predicted DNA-binding transcriptional regulator AlpA